MKNQYYGDVNDYKKYSLIRTITAHGEISIAFCWALTKDDGLSDGKKIGYLKEPSEWSRHDPAVYEQLRADVIFKKQRKVENIEESNLIPNSRFFKRVLKDNANERDVFFQEFLNFSQNSELIFFDPDNGIEVKSVARGKPGSSKYVYWKELENFYQLDKSLLIYQHFPRVNRELFITSLSSKVFRTTCASTIFMFVTSHVLFLLIPQQRHETIFRKESKRLANSWKGRIKVKEVSRSTTVAVNFIDSLSAQPNPTNDFQ